MRKHSAILCIGVAASVALFVAANAAQAQDKVIRIGGLFAMSGPGSYFGVQDKQGIELAIEQLNKTGVNGYRFEVQYEDSACSPLPATQAAKRLLEQYKPDVVLGEECSDATLAIMPLMEQAKVPLLNAGSSSIKVTDPEIILLDLSLSLPPMPISALTRAPRYCSMRTPMLESATRRCSAIRSSRSAGKSLPISASAAT